MACKLHIFQLLKRQTLLDSGPVKRFQYHKVCNPEARVRIDIAKLPLISYCRFHVCKNVVL